MSQPRKPPATGRRATHRDVTGGMGEADGQRRGAVRRLTVAGLAAVSGAALLVGLGLVAAGSGSSSSRQAPAAAAMSSVSPGARLVLPAPHRLVAGGLGVGFPHSRAGAVAAAASFARGLATLDPSRASQVAALVAAPQAAGLAQQAAEAVAEARIRLGLPPAPASGLSGQNQADPDPAGPALTFVPQACQIRQAARDRVQVWLLGLGQLTLPEPSPSPGNTAGSNPPRGPLRPYPLMTGMELVWTGGDWRLASTAVPVPEAKRSLAGTPDAYAKGWTDLVLTEVFDD